MALRKLQPGYRMNRGEDFNPLIDQTNDNTAAIAATGQGGAGAPVVATSLATSGVVDLAGATLALSNVSAALTAHAGGGQASALALTALVNQIGTVATIADSVKLPEPTVVGQVCIVANKAANSAQVFGAGTGTINGVATGTGVALAGGKTGIYIALTTGAAAAWVALLGA